MYLLRRQPFQRWTDATNIGTAWQLKENRPINEQVAFEFEKSGLDISLALFLIAENP